MLLEDFITSEEADTLRGTCHDIIDQMHPEEHNTVFTTLEMKRVGHIYM